MKKDHESFENLPVDQIQPNPDQPRLVFDLEELKSLSASIQEHGLLQPVRVEGPYPGIVSDAPVYFLVDGERRLRATKLAGLPSIKAIVIDPTNKKEDGNLAPALVANLQRADLNPIEEAKAYAKLREMRHTIRNIAVMIGRSIGHINFRLKLLDFEPEIQELFISRMLPLDPEVVYGLDRLPEKIRVKTAIRFAQKGSGTESIRRGLAKISMNYCQDKDRDLTKSKTSPMLEISGNDPNNSKIFQVLNREGIVPPWELVELASKETCKYCPFGETASIKLCKDCGAVDLIRHLTKLAHERGG